MSEYVYLIIRTNEQGEEKTIAACRNKCVAEGYRDQLNALQELDSLGWNYKVEPLKVSG